MAIAFLSLRNAISQGGAEDRIMDLKPKIPANKNDVKIDQVCSILLNGVSCWGFNEQLCSENNFEQNADLAGTKNFMH